MGMTIVLDTPEQINLWVLLSRRAQLKLHLKGYPVKGLVAWFKKNLPVGEGGKPVRTAKDCIIPIEYAISAAGGEVDYSWVNLHIMEIVQKDTVFQDMGIYSSPDDISEGSYLGQMYKAGRAEIVLTTQEPRPANGELYTIA
jgi:hypothetical protein